MYSASIQNADGEVLVLTGNETNWQLLSIIGLNPTQAQINTTNLSGMDGAMFNSSKLTVKNIVITLRITSEAEKNRLLLEHYFRPKQACRFFYTNSRRNVYIDGYVENFECDVFAKGQTAQISIICPYPYFIDTTEVMADISSTAGAFTFPFYINQDEPIAFSSYDHERTTNIYNGCGSEIGAKIVILFSAAVNSVEIINIDTGEKISLNYAFLENDVVTIITRKTQKSVKLARNGVTTNIFPALQRGSTLFQLHTGSNLITFAADEGAANDDVQISFYFSAEYNGV